MPLGRKGRTAAHSQDPLTRCHQGGSEPGSPSNRIDSQEMSTWVCLPCALTPRALLGPETARCEGSPADLTTLCPQPLPLCLGPGSWADPARAPLRSSTTQQLPLRKGGGPWADLASRLNCILQGVPVKKLEGKGESSIAVLPMSPSSLVKAQPSKHCPLGLATSCPSGLSRHQAGASSRNLTGPTPWSPRCHDFVGRPLDSWVFAGHSPGSQAIRGHLSPDTHGLPPLGT